MSTQPNIVLLMVDQWRFDCLSIAGHPIVETPFLDGLALQGTRFTRAYSATPMCLPARAALHTGLTHASHGRLKNLGGVWDYPITLAGEFTRHGYQTQAVGKMHTNPERLQLGFQNVILHGPLGIVRKARSVDGFDPGMVDDYIPWLRRELGREATFFDHGVDSNAMVARPWDKPEHTHPTNWVVSEGIDFLRRRDPSKPFFLHLSINAPHPPLDPPAWAFESYLHREMPEPPMGDWADDLEGFHQDFQPDLFSGRLSPNRLQRARAGYYGHMSHIDQQLNRFIEALAQYGLKKNTYICFVSDHGEMLGDHNLYRKCFPYEGSAHVPMLLAGPRDSGIKRGHTNDALIELRDVMPTLLSCANLPIPESVEGRSFLSQAHGSSEPLRECLHGEFPVWGQNIKWIVDGKMKYIRYEKSKLEQLFNLEEDPTECVDLSKQPEFNEQLMALRGKL